jgi:hypothetical protein
VLVVVGGQSRKVGKTSVATALIRAIPEARWTAVKIAAHRHSAASPREAPFSISEARPGEAGDSGRYLEAGAEHAYLIEAAGSLRLAVPAIQKILDSSRNVICESNRLLEFFEPGCYLLVVVPSSQDWKESARRHAARADAVVVAGDGTEPPWLEGKPVFRVSPPDHASPGLAAFLRAMLLQGT